MYKLENINRILFDNIDRLIDNNLLVNKKIYLFGANLICEQSIEYLRSREYIVSGVLDNNNQRIQMIKNKEMPLFCNVYELQLPDTIEISESMVILICIHDYNAAASQLVKLGCSENRQLYNLLDYSCLSEQNDIDFSSMITKEEMKKYQIGLLQIVKEICTNHQLKFFLCGGTLLGAIRHKGYIPWDDDIDIFMPVDDLIELKKIIKSYEYIETLDFVNNGMPHFFTRLANKSTVLEEIHYPFIMKSGISIDIFPLSGLPKDIQQQKKFKQEILQFRKKHDKFFLNYNNYTDQGIIQKLKGEYINLINRYDFYECEYVGYFMTGKFDRELLSKEDFKHTIYVEFEKEMYPVFSGYKNYLRNLYGDYMELPPVEQRVNKHSFRACRI